MPDDADGFMLAAEGMNSTMSEPQPPNASPLAEATVEGFANIGIVGCMPDAPLSEVAFLMANNRVHAVVVVDDSTAEPPVITDSDLIAAAASGEFEHLSASDIASSEAVSVQLDAPLEDAARLLAERGASHVIVRDHRGTPIGVLSSLDVARAISGRDRE